VTRFGVVLAICCVFPALAASSDLDNLLKKIETRYNQAGSLKLVFSETYAGIQRPVQTESGVLYLRKPGRMRWDYTSPQGKVFLSDGKEVFEYTPGDQQAIKSKLKQTEDMRAPLAFLLGKLDFKKEFKSFKTKPDANGTWIVAEPKSDNLAYTEVEFLASPEGEIRQVRFTLQDTSKMSLAFSNEELNVPIVASIFNFHPPPGVQVIDQSEQ
jgi:outer membrane lipoprotein carrier protein